MKEYRPEDWKVPNLKDLMRLMSFLEVSAFDKHRIKLRKFEKFHLN